MSKSNKMGVVQLTILTMVNMMGSGLSCCPPSSQKWVPFRLSPGW
jgi:putrescine:ornithine antiporter